jgi:ribonuclease Z
MPELIFMGTSSAVAGLGRENTHYLLIGDRSMILIDCGGNPIRRILEAGRNYERLTDVVLTHFHPDHVSGLPLLIMDLWILGRTKPLSIYGPEHAVIRAEKMVDLFGMDQWDGLYPLDFRSVEVQAGKEILKNSEFIFRTIPTDHTLPGLGYQIEHRKSGFRIVISGDTSPTEELELAARGVDVLIHEAGGDYQGHTSAQQAGQIARKSGVGKLYLVHYSLHNQTRDDLVRSAQAEFTGKVIAAEKFFRIEF